MPPTLPGPAVRPARTAGPQRPRPYGALRTRAARLWGLATVRDGALAVTLAVLGLVPTFGAIGVELSDLPHRPADALAGVLVLAQSLPLAARRRWPAACLALVGAAVAADELLAYPTTFASIGLYVAIYSAGAYVERGRRAVVAGAAAGYVTLAVALTVAGSPSRPVDLLAFFVVLTVVWLVGSAVRRWRADATERQVLAADAATARERARIARELHDVVTHHVTAMVVQADATQFLVPDGSDRAVDGLAAISSTGRRALTELRYLLGVLEATGEAHVAALAPTLGQVSDLVADARRAGQPVDLVDDGPHRTLPDAVELAAYRVVQEGLTNALRHAPGAPTTVDVRYAAAHVEVVVTTGSVPAGGGAPAAPDARLQSARSTAGCVAGGRGLVGLRERVRLLDGELDAGFLPDGRFRLRALVPTTPPGRTT
ncbi:sensor histidine kinase [Flavimobilis rhizosphaerae]|uniref:sensor histidine kinase n=1 Tax=Flavimobilis rhizosphaerae TaxID=2775421 RepID=UPI002E2E7893|nr:histidine kinase [Flavimobilis rhizosphaerae]